MIMDLEVCKIEKKELNFTRQLNASYEEQFKALNNMIELKEKEVLLLENIADTKDLKVHELEKELKSTKRTNKLILYGALALGAILLIAK